MEDAMPVDGSLEVRRLGSDGHFALVGELDMASKDHLLEALQPAIADDTTLTLDLSELTFVDVAGARAIVGLVRQVGECGPLVLRSPSPTVLSLLRRMEADTFPGVHIELPESA